MAACDSFFLVFHHLAIQFVHQRVNCRIKVLVFAFHEHILAANVYGGFGFLLQFFYRRMMFTSITLSKWRLILLILPVAYSRMAGCDFQWCPVRWRFMFCSLFRVIYGDLPGVYVVPHGILLWYGGR